MSQPLTWYTKPFSSLTINELYDILKLRIDVFVVEQKCYYPEIDKHDKHPETLHLFAYANNTIVAYLRILPKGTSYNNYISLGRVVVAPASRKLTIGHLLMEKALVRCKQHFFKQNIKISAQEHLEKYYKTHGFIRDSAMYLEDNIPHIAMLKKYEE